jgi:hypothetical protein
MSKPDRHLRALDAPGLGDALDALLTEQSTPSCPVSRTIEALGADDGEKLRRLIDETAIAAEKIAAAMRRNGQILGESAIRRHRKRQADGECPCTA